MTTEDTKTRNAANAKGWVYVFVSNPGGDESYLGLHDKDKAVDFIPAFESREAANDCFLSMPREKGVKYEVHAVHIEELVNTAKAKGFTVAIVDHEGRVVKE